MADILIRNVPDEINTALDAHASAEGKSKQEFLLALIKQAASGPVIKQNYQIRAWGGEGFINIQRTFDGAIGGGAKNCSQEQFDAYKKAKDYAKRNGPGDREKAISLLQTVFDEVFEV